MAIPPPTLPFVDRNGKTLAVGMRVKFSVSTHYVNTREGTGTVTGFGAYGHVNITSDAPIFIGERPMRETTEIGVSTKYDDPLRAWKAERPIYHPDGFRCGAEWVEIVETPKPTVAAKKTTSKKAAR